MISVIIPTFNRAEYIFETIDSVCKQDYTGEIEIIVVDDGSTDGTDIILEDLQSKISLLKVITTENSGVSSARNTGMLAAKGDFIQFLDSDDLIAPTKFSKQIKLLENNDNYGLCYCTSASFKYNPSSITNIFSGSDQKYDVILPAFMYSGKWQVHSPIYRRYVCERIGQWNENLTCWEDWEYGIRAGLLDIKPIFCNEILAYTREHDGERLSQDSLEKTAISLENASNSIINKMHVTGNKEDVLFDIMARHLIAAGRAFASLDNTKSSERCLRKAVKNARSKKLKVTTLLYIAISKLMGYKTIVQLSRKILNIKNGR